MLPFVFAEVRTFVFITTKLAKTGKSCHGSALLHHLYRWYINVLALYFVLGSSRFGLLMSEIPVFDWQCASISCFDIGVGESLYH